jgi:hypothetical protein
VQGRISFSIKLVATAASSGTGTSYETTCELNSEPQNNEQEISNDEVWNRFALTISD